tara:strand:+ start:172 stop:708 length:537 start_codon:yes stop_codon:yes gene_type:complete
MILKSYLSKISYSNNSNFYDITFKSYKKNKKTIFKILVNDAKKIALANEGIKSNNLKTYDLFLSLLSLLKINIYKVEIHKDNDSSKSILFLNYQTKIIKLDLDYVDAVILSLLTLCPLYIDGKYFSDTISQIIENDTINEDYSVDNVFRLKKTLRDLIHNEEYESAAKIRDKIKKLSS